jgi:hypothetical protein
VVAALVPGVLVTLAPTAARACRYPPPARYELRSDPADTTAPTLLRAEEASLRRGQDAGCGGSTSDCADIASLTLDLAGTDDRTAAGDLGYRVTVVEGALPQGALPPDFVVDVSLLPYTIRWVERDGPPFHAVLEVRAVDRAGNESAPLRLEVGDGRFDGCAAAPGARAAWGVLPLALALALTLRRRQAPRRDRSAQSVRTPRR